MHLVWNDSVRPARIEIASNVLICFIHFEDLQRSGEFCTVWAGIFQLPIILYLAQLWPGLTSLLLWSVKTSTTFAFLDSSD